MGELREVIKSRRSIRNYQDQAVPEAALQEILEAVQWSPSWANTQCWEIIVVKNADTKQKLQGTLSQGNPATRAMVEAPVILVLAGRLNTSGFYKGQLTTKHGDWYLFDLGIATQSICLTAHHLGLGTVVVGLFDHDAAQAALEVPEGVAVVALLPLGYPAKQPAAPKRREVGEFTHQERF